MNSKISEKDDLVEVIYDAIADPTILDTLVSALQAQLGAHAGLMFSYDTDGPSLWSGHGFDSSLFAPYAAYYHHFDPWKYALVNSQQLRTGTVWAGELLVGAETVRRSPLVQELLLPNGLGPILGCCAQAPQSGPLAELSFYRRPGADPFGSTEIGLLREYAPHLSRMARLRLRRGSEAAVSAWSAEIIDGLPWALILVNAKRRPVYLNREAERILGDDDGLALEHGGLGAAHRDDARRLDRLIGLAVIGDAGGRRSGGDLRIVRPSGSQSWLVTIVPLGSRPTLGITTDLPRAAVYVIDPLRRPRSSGARLSALFGFTPAEERLALDLLRDLSLAEIAERHAVALSTIKTQALRLFAKTGTNRQSHLVALFVRCLMLPDQSSPIRDLARQ